MNSIEIKLEEEEYKKYTSLKKKYNCNDSQLLKYLLSMEDSKVSKGGAAVERKIKQWIISGYTDFITITGLRYADYGTGKKVGKNTAEKIYNLYKEEIECHNNKLSEYLKNF